MAIPKDIVEEVRARTDIVELIGRTVTLKRQGRSWLGLCPFHADKRPSFHVVPDKGIYNCFACGEGGDVFKFLMKTRGLGFGEAVRELAGPAGVTIEERQLSTEERQRLSARADLYDVVDAASKWFERTLLVATEGAPGRAYLEKRGITLETARKYRLGFAPDGWDHLVNYFGRERIPVQLGGRAGLFKRSERTGGTYDTFRNRLIFPITDDRGRVVAFGGRLLPGEDDAGPKYLNSPESEIYEKSKTLYGLSYARTAVQRHDRVLLVEGYFDAVSLWQAGFEEVVATCGTALTAHHLETLRRLTRKVIAQFDSDEAGLRAAAKSMDLFLAAGVEARRLDLRDAKDPDEFVQKNGPPAFEELLGRTEPLVDLVVRRTVEKEGPSAEGRVRALQALIPLLRRLPDLLRGQMASRAAGWLGYREAQVLDALGAIDDDPDPQGSINAAPTRWVPTKELSHFLWLLLAWPERVSPLLATADPATISDRRAVLEAIARLAAGKALPEVVEACPDPDVARTLLSIAAKPAIYEEQQAESAARSILARLELAGVEAQIALISAKIAACETSGDKSSYGDQARVISSLYVRRAALQAVVARRASRS